MMTVDADNFPNDPAVHCVALCQTKRGVVKQGMLIDRLYTAIMASVGKSIP